MKKILFTLLASAISVAAFSQQSTIKYWDNGNKKSEGLMIGGTAVSSNDSKAVQAQKMQGAVKDGKWSYWFENGKQSGEEYYNKGSQTGTWKTWYDNGNISSEINFEAGTATFWFSNGKKQSEGKMMTGMVRDGKWTGWYENGRINFEGSYKNGKKEGVWVWYNEKGEKTTEQVYQDDKVTGTKNF